jgi:hypothetical protein
MDETVDTLTARLREVGRRREDLRLAGAGREDLEANRLEIVQLQLELSRALIAAHHPAAA